MRRIPVRTASMLALVAVLLWPRPGAAAHQPLPAASPTPAATPEAAETTLTLEPIRPVRSGERARVIAHLETEPGNPVVGKPVSLYVDEARLNLGRTDEAGSVSFLLPSYLRVGSYTVEVRFDGSPELLASRASGLAEVVIPVATVLTVDQLEPVPLGSRPTVVARLRTESGQPAVDEAVELYLDGERLKRTRTDPSGVASMTLGSDLAPGSYNFQAVFPGSGPYFESETVAHMVVEPAQLEIHAIPPLPGLEFSLNGQIFRTDAQGIAKLLVYQTGSYQLTALATDPGIPGLRVEFRRWASLYTATREVAIPRDSLLEVGFEVSKPVTVEFVDLEGRPVDPSRISSFTLKSSGGGVHSFEGPGPHWLQAGRVIRDVFGIHQSELEYAVQDVMLRGANVVNQGQQRFSVEQEQVWRVELLLYAMQVDAKDALFGFPVGKQLRLEYPDGHFEQLELSPEGTLAVDALPRGEYRLRVEGVRGYSPSVPVALSRDQVVSLKVISALDLGLAFIVAATFALGLLFVGRPYLWPRLKALAPRIHRPELPDLKRRLPGMPGPLQPIARRVKWMLSPELRTLSEQAPPVSLPDPPESVESREPAAWVPSGVTSRPSLSSLERTQGAGIPPGLFEEWPPIELEVDGNPVAELTPVAKPERSPFTPPPARTVTPDPESRPASRTAAPGPEPQPVNRTATPGPEPQPVNRTVRLDSEPKPAVKPSTDRAALESDRTSRREPPLPSRARPAIPVLAISNQASVRDQLAAALSGQSDFRLVQAADHQGLLASELLGADPEIVVLDCTLGGQAATDLIDRLNLQYPASAIVAIVDLDDAAQLQQATLAGARGLLPRSLSPEVLAGTLRRVHELELRRRSANRQGGDGAGRSDPLQVLAVYSPRGGSGVSTVAANLAIALHEEAVDKVLLIDGKLLFGHLGVMLNLKATNSVVDLIPHPNVEDPDFVAEVVTPHRTGIDVLLSPAELSAAQGIRPEHLVQMLRTLRSRYEFIVIDAGSALTDNCLALLEAADRLLLVCTPELATLQDADGFIEFSSTLQHPPSKTLVVLNRAGMTGAVETRNAQAVLQRKIFAEVPDDPVSALRALNRGIPLLLQSPRSRTSKAIRQMALALVELNQHEPNRLAQRDGSAPAKASRRTVGARAG